MGTRTRADLAIGAGILALFGGLAAMPARQAPVVQPLAESVLREYTGVYQWGPNAFVYLQMWDEFSGFGKPQLVAFDESGDVRTLYPTDATTTSSPAPAPRCPPRSNRASHFSATPPARLSR